jgi:hypothetical protein
VPTKEAHLDQLLGHIAKPFVREGWDPHGFRLVRRGAAPRFVVVSEGRERGKRVNPYEAVGAELWRTSREGALLIRLNQTGIQAEGF